MKLYASAAAGSENKSDVFVTVAPADTITVTLLAKPIILRQFGPQIEAVVREAAAQEEVEGAAIQVKDGGGALDFTIRARVRCALRRAKKGDTDG